MIISYISMALSVLLAWQLKWEARDLIWSLWLSSLVTGFAYIYYDILYFWLGPSPPKKTRPAQEGISINLPDLQKEIPRPILFALKTIPAVFSLVFFTLECFILFTVCF